MPLQWQQNSNGCEMCERKIKSRQHRYDTKMYGDEKFMRVEKNLFKFNFFTSDMCGIRKLRCSKSIGVPRELRLNFCFRIPFYLSSIIKENHLNASMENFYQKLSSEIKIWECGNKFLSGTFYVCHHHFFWLLLCK